VIDALLAARAEALQAADLASAMERSVAAGRDPALAGAITGALIGAFIGAEAIPPAMTGVLARLEVIEDVAARLAAVGADRR
jgi:ADP-ribosylglycohydrolase